MSVFGENNSRCLSNILQTHISWNFGHIFRTYNHINYRSIWFAKVIIVFIMTAQVLFFDVFSEKEPHLNAVEWYLYFIVINNDSFTNNFDICIISSRRATDKWCKIVLFFYFLPFTCWRTTCCKSTLDFFVCRKERSKHKKSRLS